MANGGVMFGFSELLAWIFSTVSICLAIFLYFRSRKFKRIAYSVRNVNIFRDMDRKFPLLDVKYSNKKITDLSVSRILICNTGKETIDASDVAQTSPITIKSDLLAQILDISIEALDNAANKFEVIHGNDERKRRTGIISFEYIDPKEGVVLDVVHTGGVGSDVISVSGAVKGARVRTH